MSYSLEDMDEHWFLRMRQIAHTLRDCLDARPGEFTYSVDIRESWKPIATLIECEVYIHLFRVWGLKQHPPLQVKLKSKHGEYLWIGTGSGGLVLEIYNEEDWKALIDILLKRRQFYAEFYITREIDT